MGRRRGRVGTEPILGLHRPQTNFNTSGHFWNYFLHRVNQMPQKNSQSCAIRVSNGSMSSLVSRAAVTRSLQLTGTILVLASCEMGHLNGTATLIWNNSNFSCIHRSCITWESYCSFLVLIHSGSILFNSLLIYLFSECHTSSSKSK